MTLFGGEALKLLDQYSEIRKEVLRQNFLVRQAQRYSGTQERLIMECREFIIENLQPTLHIIEQLNQEIDKDKIEARKKKREKKLKEGSKDKEQSSDTEEYDVMEKMGENMDKFENVYTKAITNPDDVNLFTQVREERDMLRKKIQSMAEEIRTVNHIIDMLTEDQKKQVKQIE